MEALRETMFGWESKVGAVGIHRHREAPQLMSGVMVGPRCLEKNDTVGCAAPPRRRPVFVLLCRGDCWYDCGLRLFPAAGVWECQGIPLRH